MKFRKYELVDSLKDLSNKKYPIYQYDKNLELYEMRCDTWRNWEIAVIKHTAQTTNMCIKKSEKQKRLQKYFYGIEIKCYI
jgi:hypothetical protein